MSRLYLIRHGSTPANEQHLYCGSTDLPLSETGLRALRGLKPGYSGVEAARFVTSGMRRTEQTLDCLFGPVSHTCDPRLREMDFGAFEMHSYEQLKDCPEYQAWITGDNEAKVTPGGESGNGMKDRVLEALRELQAAGTDTVVVTHGGVIAAIMERLFPGEGKNRYQWQPGPGRGYVIDAQGWRPIPEE